MPTTTHLVIGATGKTGRRLTARLQAAGHAVRPVSRPAFVWEDRATWAPALDGVHAAYVAYAPDLAVPGAGETVAALARQAAAAGVQRLVLLSGRGEEAAQEAEQAVLAAGVPSTTVVRCAWFMQNFAEAEEMAGPVAAGALALPVGAEVAEPFVDLDDVVEVAFAAMTQDGHAGRVHELTGPRALTFAEAARELGDALGRPVAFVPVPIEEYAAGMAAAGVPDDVAELVTYLFTEVLDGRNASTTDGVERVLGRPPRSFATYARAAAAAGAWADAPLDAVR